MGVSMVRETRIKERHSELKVDPNNNKTDVLLSNKDSDNRHDYKKKQSFRNRSKNFL